MRLTLLLLASVLAAGKSVPRHNLTFMLTTSFGQFGFNSSGALPAADMALEDINSDPNVLPGYNFMYDKVRDSQVCKYPIAVLQAVQTSKKSCQLINRLPMYIQHTHIHSVCSRSTDGLVFHRHRIWIS